MPSFCPSCKLTFEDRDLTPGPDGSPCPRCNGTLQPITRKPPVPLADRVDRRRKVTPTAPAGAVIVPTGSPSFTDSLTPTEPRAGGAMIGDGELQEEPLDRQEEPTMPGGSLPAASPGPRFMQDEPTVPRAPIPPPRPEKPTPTAPAPSNEEPTRPGASMPERPEMELPPLPGPSTAGGGREPDPQAASPGEDPRAAPAGIVPPAVLGGPQSADLVPPGMVTADGRRNTGLSDVFAPVGAFDPTSGEVIDTGPVDRPEDAASGGEPTPQADGTAQASSGGSAGGRLLEFDEGSSVTGGDLELDLDHGGMNPAAEQPGVGISPGMSTGQTPKARPPLRPEAPLPSRPMATHEMKAVARPGLPGWARLLVLLVLLGVAGIVALELFSEDELAAESREAAALDTLADVAAETARAERLLADIDQEQQDSRLGPRKAGPRKHKARVKHKSRRAGKSAHARAEDDDDDGDGESARAQALRYYKQGNEHLKRRSFDAAVKAFHTALAADPGFAYAHRGLGVAYASMKEPKKAIQQYQLYLKKAPTAPDAPQVRKILEKAGAQ